MRDMAPMTVGSQARRSDARWGAIKGAARVWLVPTILGLIGLVFIHHPMLLSGFARGQTEGDDPQLINYLLEHGYLWLTGHPQHRHFWNIPFFYPAPNVAAFSDTLLSVGPVYCVWRVAGFLPDTAFQLWMLTASSLNYLAGYLLLRSGFRRGDLGSSCGAFLFAFGASRSNQLEHQQLLPQVYIVATLLALLCIFRGRTVSFLRSTALWSVAGVSLAVQFYASFYLGWFLALTLGLAGLWALVLADYRPVLVAVVRDQWPAIAVAAALSSLAIFPLLSHYLEVARQVGMRTEFEIRIGMPHWTAWVYEGPDSWILGWLPNLTTFKFLQLEQAHRMGIGFVTPLVCAVGLAQRWREPMVRLIALTMISLLIAITRFEREIWVEAGIGWWTVCAVELFRRERTTFHRQVVGIVAVLASLILFPALTMEMAVVLAALLFGVSRLLPGPSRALVMALVPIILIGFPCLTAYSPRPWALVIGVTIVGVIEATPWPVGRRPTVGRLVTVSVIIFGSLCYFGSEIVYWRCVAAIVPAAGVLRAITRALLLGLIPASLGMACFCDGLRTNPKHLAAACILGLVCVLEQGVTTTSFDKVTMRAAVSKLARQIDRHRTSFYYSPHVTGKSINMNKYHLEAMWAGIEANVPTINGYSGVAPPSWLSLSDLHIDGEADIHRLGHALGQWAAQNGLEPESICWIRGRDDAVVWNRKEPDESQPASVTP